MSRSLSAPLQEADLASSLHPVAPSTKSSTGFPLQRPHLHEPIPSAAALLNDCVSTLSDIIDDSLTTPAAPPKGMNDISMSSISSSDIPGLHQFNTASKPSTTHRSRRRSSKPVVVGHDISRAAAAERHTMDSAHSTTAAAGAATLTQPGQPVPRFARPPKAHMVRQASVKAEREHREHRIRERAKSNRGTGKTGQWTRIATNTTMVGIPDPEKVATYSTNLLNQTTNTSACSASAAFDSTSASTSTAHYKHRSSSSPTTPITHHIRTTSPVKGGQNLSISLEPAMATWGTGWGLRK